MRPLRAAPGAILTTQQLYERRFTDKNIEAMVRWQWLIRLHQGVYFVPSPDLLSRAALVAAGGGELVHASALAHLNLRLRELGPIHVNIGPDRRRRGRGGRIKAHRARLPETDVVEFRGLRTTTPTRTLLDVAKRQPPYALFRALEQAERLPLHTDRPRLETHPSLTKPLELFDHYGPSTRSDAEAMFLFLIESFGLQRPLVNRPIGDDETDFHWPDHHLAVEVDGYEFHDGLFAFQQRPAPGNQGAPQRVRAHPLQRHPGRARGARRRGDPARRPPGSRESGNGSDPDSARFGAEITGTPVGRLSHGRKPTPDPLFP